MPRRFALFAVAAVGLTALAPMAAAAKLYLVETTDSGFSLHLSHAERRALVSLIDENPTLEVDGETTTYLDELGGDILAFMADEAQASGENVRFDFFGFFEFVIEHWDSIYAIIQTFIDMFTANLPAHPGYCRIETMPIVGLAA